MAAGSRARVSFLSLVVLGFFWVSGGIYGNEAVLRDAAPGPTFALMLFVAPVLVGLPLGLISIELATACVAGAWQPRPARAPWCALTRRGSLPFCVAHAAFRTTVALSRG